MRYTLVGRSGLRVSELCLGAMTFGEEWGWGANKEESRAMFDAFVEAGGNFVDTANVYTNGTSERFVGEFMRGQRERIVLATKYTNSLPTTDPNAAGNQRKNMVQSLEASLRRLGTDYIDLYWLHIWDALTPIEEVMRAFDDLTRQGKVLYAGISDAPAWVVARANTLAELRGWTPFVGLQIEYSLIERTPERELLPMAASLDIGVTTWGALAGGVLTGKYFDNTGGTTAGGTAADEKRYDRPDMRQFLTTGERHRAVVAAVQSVAKQVGRSPAQVALAWLRPRRVIPIVGARKLSQLQNNLESLSLRLEPELLAALDAASRIEMGFPADFYTKDLVRSMTYGGMRDLIDA